MNWIGQNRGEHQNESKNRVELINQSIRLAMDAAYGQPLENEQQITEVLGGLVREKLLSAEDSYRLRDQLLDREALHRLIDRKIETALARRKASSAAATQTH